MRDGDVVAPFCRAKDALLDPAGLGAEQSVGRFTEAAKDKLVKVLNRLGDVSVNRWVGLAAWVVVVLLSAALADRDLHTIRITLYDTCHLGREPDLHVETVFSE